MHKFIKIFLYTMAALLLTLILLIGGLYLYSSSINIAPPETKSSKWANQAIQEHGDTHMLGNNWLHKNSEGLYEMYVEGSAFDRGVAMGKLSDSLIRYQEQAFVEQLQVMIPSPGYMKFLKNFIALFNKNLDEYIPLEFQQEIYGVSQAADSAFDFIAPAYSRMLNYHAAHDIGHAMQNMNLVACTSFGVWNNRAQDSTLTIGRNFDFYVGDAFAQNKIVLFVRPEQGIPFVIITWGGMTGAVSGMNAEGLTLTLNAAKSEIPTSAATPISLIAREVLQYASTIDEALAIAKKRKSFVAESMLIGSAKDNRAALIEKTPETTLLYETKTPDQLISTNHFQSDSLKREEIVQAPIEDYATTYRYARMEELLAKYAAIGPEEAAEILRNKEGLENNPIGLGNEKAVNQLIAHHGIIFQPQKRKFWIATAPYQLGTFIGYSLDSVFNKQRPHFPVHLPADTLASDAFLQQGYNDFLAYKHARNTVQAYLKAENPNGEALPDSILADLTEKNPNFYLGYKLLGDYYKHRDVPKAIACYKEALACELPSAGTREHIQQELNTLKKTQ